MPEYSYKDVPNIPDDAANMTLDIVNGIFWEPVEILE